MFIAVDGIDGAGKTTLVGNLADLLKSIKPVCTKEPTGDSKWGHRVRLAAAEGRLSREKEIEYFHKDRKKHIEDIILPAIKQGKVVISDRYVDSTLAFQADTPEEADALYEKLVPEILVPDVIFILCCPVEEGLRRIRLRDEGNLTHYETPETLRKARRIYESRTGKNYVHLDATGTIEDTLSQVVEALRERFEHLREILDTGLRERLSTNGDSYVSLAHSPRSSSVK